MNRHPFSATLFILVFCSYIDSKKHITHALLVRQLARKIPHVDEGLIKGHAGEKGFGVFATRPFKKGELVCEFQGKLQVSKKEDLTEGVYFFNFKVGKLHYRSLPVLVFYSVRMKQLKQLFTY